MKTFILFCLLVGINALDLSLNRVVENILPIHPSHSFTTVRTTTTTIKAAKACDPTETILNGKKSCGGKLLLNEQFGNNFDTNTKWEKENKFAGTPDYEFVLYTSSSENLYVSRSTLYIKPTLHDRAESREVLDLGTDCTGTPGTTQCVQKPQAFLMLPPILSARINTKQFFNFIYGVIEVRAKLPKGDWIYPEIFLQPKRREYGKGYESGQIRIAFAPGNYMENQKLYGGVILDSSRVGRNVAMFVKESQENWGDDFHIYTVRWEPERISFAVDGEVYGNLEPGSDGFAAFGNETVLKAASRWKSGTSLAPFDKEMYISIGVGVGGHSFNDTENKPWLNNDPKAQKLFYRAKNQWHATWGIERSLQVDYIKVYAL